MMNFQHHYSSLQCHMILVALETFLIINIVENSCSVFKKERNALIQREGIQFISDSEDIYIYKSFYKILLNFLFIIIFFTIIKQKKLFSTWISN